MKNYKRAQRRHKAYFKFERRLKIWIQPGSWHNDWRNIGGSELDEARDEIRRGEAWTFLRTTSRPCNCGMCTEHKYNRIQHQYRFKNEEF